ncbi:MAG: MerR family transcriptional regulator [Fusobacteriaceae bacterium]
MIYMKMSEACQYSGMCKSTLQKYDKLGILVPMRSPTNRRVYTREMIDEFFKMNKYVVAVKVAIAQSKLDEERVK